MGSFWDDVKQTIKKGATTAVEKTEEYGKIGKIKIDILNVSKQLDKAYRDLGEISFENLKASKKKDLAKDKTVQELLTKIDELKQDITEKEKEIEKIKEEAEAKKDVEEPVVEVEVEVEKTSTQTGKK